MVAAPTIYSRVEGLLSVSRLLNTQLVGISAEISKSGRFAAFRSASRVRVAI